MKTPRILVYGYGNPGRQDDGIGPAIVEMLEAEPIEGVETDSNYQLQVEDALTVAEYDEVVFVDASAEGEEPYTWIEVEPAHETTWTSHHLSPEAVLALCRDLYGRSVKGRVLAVRGRGWEFIEGMTAEGMHNMREAYRALRKELIRMVHECVATS